MPKRKSALTKGKMIAGRFLLFLVLFLFFCRVQCGPLGLFLGLRVQILLRLLFLGSPRPPFPHERGWKHPFLPLGGCRDQEGLARLDKGELAARGCGEQGGDLEGPAVSASSPLCGSGIFFPHGTQGRFVQFSQFDSPPGGGGRGMDKKENPATVVTLKEKSLPPRLALSFPLD